VKLLNAHAQPIFTLRVFYDHLLTVKEKKNSFHFDVTIQYAVTTQEP